MMIHLKKNMTIACCLMTSLLALNCGSSQRDAKGDSKGLEEPTAYTMAPIEDSEWAQLSQYASLAQIDVTAFAALKNINASIAKNRDLAVNLGKFISQYETSLLNANGIELDIALMQISRKTGIPHPVWHRLKALESVSAAPQNNIVDRFILSAPLLQSDPQVQAGAADMLAASLAPTLINPPGPTVPRIDCTPPNIQIGCPRGGNSSDTQGEGAPIPPALVPALDAGTVLVQPVGHCSAWLVPRQLLQLFFPDGWVVEPSTIPNRCLNWDFTPQSIFPYWWAAGVNHNNIAGTYVSSVPYPGGANTTKALVFLAAGQQEFWGNGNENVITGQLANWKAGCTTGCSRPVQTGSMLQRILAMKSSSNYSAYLPAQTRIDMAWDTQFNFIVNSNEKDQMINAYYYWLRSHIRSNVVEKILLVGASRGGCLVYQLAKRFRQDPTLANVKLVVQTLDPVCNAGQAEFGFDRNNRFANPLVPNQPLDFTANSFRPENEIGQPANTWFLNIVGGGLVTSLNTDARGATVLSIGLGGPLSSAIPAYGTAYGDLIQQYWVPLQHEEIGRQLVYAPMTLNRLERHLVNFLGPINYGPLP